MSSTTATHHGITNKVAQMNETLDIWDDEELFPQRGLKNEVPLTAFGVRV